MKSAQFWLWIVVLITLSGIAAIGYGVFKTAITQATNAGQATCELKLLQTQMDAVNSATKRYENEIVVVGKVSESNLDLVLCCELDILRDENDR